MGFHPYVLFKNKYNNACVIIQMVGFAPSLPLIKQMFISWEQVQWL